MKEKTVGFIDAKKPISEDFIKAINGLFNDEPKPVPANAPKREEKRTNVVYLDDYRKGLHCYTPEMGDRKPDVKMKATLCHYGKHYYVDTPIELKGRGITELDPCWHEGCKKQVEGWRSYRVTKRAFEKLKKQYPISMECLLD